MHAFRRQRSNNLYNWANVLIFTVISAAMITVSSTAVRLLFGIPAQLQWYPTNGLFVAIVLAVGMIVVLVAMFGFNAVAEFSSLCGPWLVIMFVSGALVLFPALAESVLGRTQLSSFGDFIAIGDQSIWTGVNSNGEPGMGLWEVVGFAWAANTITHFGLIDMALFRYAKSSVYGLCTSAGMLFGHYVAWIAAGIMGAGAAVLLNSPIVELDPGDVAYNALGLSGYDRSRMKAGIVHVGVGGFHRSHGAYYTDKLMNCGGSSDWGICGVGLREADRKMEAVLKKQDFLYTLIVKYPDGKIENRVIGSLMDFMMGSDDPEAVINAMASPDTKIVSLTITEGGYNVSPDTGEFDFANPDAKHDLENPLQPKLVFGYLAAALRKRRDDGIPAFTVQSCDNIQHNGNLTRKVVLGFAHRQDPQLAKWIESEVCFPNAMVDRITPVTTEADVEYLEDKFGLRDAWPVTCEPFCQWVIEDNFSNSRPEWENVGAQFVSDVTPYETMKLRLLNAGHSVLGILGSIFGYETIDECVSDKLFAAYLRKFMDLEATPTLDAVEGIDLDAYKDTLIERFGNPNIKDNLARICLESSSKLPVFLIPTIAENLERGGSIQYAALVVATWCFYSDRGVNRHGKQLEIVDEMKDALHQAAKGTCDDKLSFLRLNSVFGDLASNERFAEMFATMIEQIYENPDVSAKMRTIMEGND